MARCALAGAFAQLVLMTAVSAQTTNAPATAPPPPVTSAPAAAAAERYAQAIVALDKGDTATAQRLFEEVISLEPAGDKAAQARHHLGQIYSQVKPATPNAPKPAPVPSPELAEPDPGLTNPPPLNRSRVNARYRNDEEEFIGEAGDRVFFGPGSAELGARAADIIAAQAVWLKQQPKLNASIEGHADEPSMSSMQNEELSEARAIAVRDRLIQEGIPLERLSIVPWGREAKISDCPETACQVQNRRAVTVLVPKNRIPKPPVRQGQVQPPARPTPTQ